mmetsp:Transcript_70655/g.133297  ORF Transcript_70655/g.133297 Transcript_70655/m.133297 type:complete len:264 (-) Transcript_70655:9-800(-)
MRPLPEVPEHEPATDALAVRPVVESSEVVPFNEPQPNTVGNTGYTLAPIQPYKAVDPVDQLDIEREREINARLFLKHRRRQEVREERRRKLAWGSLMSCWCCVFLVFLILIIGYWDAVRYDDWYRNDEKVGVCEDMYTQTTWDGPIQWCKMQIMVYECHSDDCSEVGGPESVHLYKTPSDCEWYSGLYGRYRCYFLREDHKIKPTSLHKQQYPGVNKTQLDFAIFGSVMIFLMTCCFAFYARVAWNDWDEFEVEPWNRYSYLD